MNLVLGPENLKVDFSFSIYDALENQKRDFDSIGVYFSGGIDSTALLLLILSELQSTNRIDEIPVTCFTVRKNDFAADKAPKLLYAISKKFKTNIKHFNYIKNKSVQNEHISTLTFVDCFVRHKTTLFLLGINRMPEESIVKFKNSLKVDYGIKKNRFIYYSPFLFLHKPQILDIIYKLGHQDLLPYTYSCTMHPTIPCMNCYACEEREWGFKTLQKNDPLFTQNLLTASEK